MRIEILPDIETSARHRHTNTMDGLVYLLECNYATLEDLQMRKSSSRSSIRRQASICECGLEALRFHASEAAAAARLHCPRVGERLRRPAQIEVTQNEYPGSEERWAGLEIGYGSWVAYGTIVHSAGNRWTVEAGARDTAHPHSPKYILYHGTHDNREDAAEQLNRAMLFMLARAPDEARIRRDLYSMSVGWQGPGFLTNHSLDNLRRV